VLGWLSILAMPYPQRLLNEGETVALDLRPHWWYFSKHILTSIPLVVLLVLIFKLRGTAQNVSFDLWGLLALVWAAWLGLQYLNWTFTHFVVTDRRVVFRTGVLAKHGVEIPMDRISNINFNQSMWERVIGAGDLEIESAGKDGQSRFDDVWHPDAVQQELYRQMEGHAKTRAGWVAPTAPPATAAPAAHTSGGTVPEQIQQLADLRDRGAITPAEFEAKKAQLLERM
jgi:membrane protein YdbS with pleckstrin-like domain